MASMSNWKQDRRVTATMVEDMLFDPILACKVLLGIKLPPHEELRILMMWTKAFTNDDSGFSTGKTFTIAVVSALRSILMQDRVSGVLSKTYAQGKLVFEYFDRWYHANPRFRYCVEHARGKPQLIHGSDVHQAIFRGYSKIRILPPNFLQDAERLKSERWNDGYFDEWTTYGKFDAFNKTVIGRVTRVNAFPDSPVRQNHVHLLSTPNFMHAPSYQIVKKLQRNIAMGNKDYARFTCNYRHVPVTDEWKSLINRKFIFHMQTNLTRGMIKAEVDGLWQRDSGSYYSSAIIERVRYNKPTYVPKRMSADDIMIGAFDTARGGGRAAGRKGDDFSFSVFCLPKSGRPFHCCTVRRNSLAERQMSGEIHRLHRLYGFSLIGYDPGGGGLFIRDSLREATQLIDNVMTKCTPIVEPGDSSGTMGDTILIPIKRGELVIDQGWGKMRSDSVLVNRLHRELQAACDQQQLFLSGEWPGWTGNGSQWDATAKRAWLNTNPSLTPEERIKAEMDLAVAQLMLVDIMRDENGDPVMDSHNMYQFGSKAKKDSAYSLVYAWFTKLIWDVVIAKGMPFAGNRGSGGHTVIAMGGI